MRDMLKTALEDKDDDELVELWRDQDHDDAYQQLKKNNEGIVYNQANRFRASPVPQKAIESQAWQHFDDAVDNYDPDSEAQFSTYLHNRLKSLDRYNKKRQNIARIPEERARKISTYETHRDRLQDELGRQPKPEEIAEQDDDLDPEEVKRIQQENRQDLYEGQYEGTQSFQGKGDKGNQILQDIREDLEPHEQEVYDHLIGHEDTPKLDTKKEVADKLDVSPGRVSQITSGIADKVQQRSHQF
ncbi:MAG: sigma-70 family RNA polymerase sigma factor [Bradymonadaceae bacterium]